MRDGEEVKPLADRLFEACVGGCSCMTKTPDFEHHDPMCHYRLFWEAFVALQPKMSRIKFWLWNAAFYWKRLRVCILCLWYLRHWPWSDLSTAEWRFQLEGESARSAFLEGWCRE